MDFNRRQHHEIKTLNIMKSIKMNHMKNLIIVLMMLLMSSWSNILIEKKTITGTVYSAADGTVLPDVTVNVKGTALSVSTDRAGKFEIMVPDNFRILVFSKIGFQDREEKISGRSIIDAYLNVAIKTLPVEVKRKHEKMIKGSVPAAMEMSYDMSYAGGYMDNEVNIPIHNTEEYSTIDENIFHNPARKPLSTFSIDVDAASYSNIRRFISASQMPPKDAVRIEEMINYFNYDYVQPEEDKPFSINTEVGTCPWDDEHYLVHIGLQGKNIPTEDLPPTNLVFLLDVSGSMNQANKLPLLKSAFKLLVNKLRPEDKVSIVVYAGAAGLVLPPTSGGQKQTIIAALDRLQAGGSTAGGQGIKLAYKTARQNFLQDGNNRVILATDGDFNVGESSNAAMERLIEEERKSGVFLTVLGFGMGNYKDSKMEILADKGNGNYAYIDNILEAKKVFVNEFGGTLFTIAKDVKIQVEFNPNVVQAYRLIGYENRKLRDEDFNDDKKDAGELGSGHTVTALYEIIPAGIKDKYTGSIDPLKYQDTNTDKRKNYGNEIMTVKLRYKKPDGDTSQLVSGTIKNRVSSFDDTSDNFRFSASVAGYGMILRGSEFKGNIKFESVLEWANNSRGVDKEGYRAEFIRLIESTKLIANI
jgi:Ca-activated chloride channel family protein